MNHTVDCLLTEKHTQASSLIEPAAFRIHWRPLEMCRREICARTVTTTPTCSNNLRRHCDLLRNSDIGSVRATPGGVRIETANAATVDYLSSIMVSF